MSDPEPAAPVTLSGRRSRRRLVLTVLGVLLLLAAAVSGYAWTQKQYFVGKDGNEVAVFRGVNAHFGPVSLYSVIENSDLRLSDLTQSAASQVVNGITASSRGDARAILARLNDQLKPLCSSQSSTPGPSATPSRTAAATSSRPATSPRLATGQPSSKVSRTPSRAASPTPTPPTGPTISTSPVPPVDCR
jgi:protein phosphatase